MDIVCFSHLRWNFVYQRPQHLLSRFINHFRVFFIEEPLFDADQQEFLDNTISKEGVWIIVPHLQKDLSEEKQHRVIERLLNDFFSYVQLTPYILWYYTPMAVPLALRLPPSLVIYDCMDELSAFKNAPPMLKEREKELLKKADLVFTGGFSLYKAKKNLHKYIYAFPSSIDKKHFGKARTDLPEPEDQASIPHPRIGFFGVVDERMNLELLDNIARQKPDWHFVIIGPTVKIDPATLPAHNNIHYLGSKDYSELPFYLSGWDIAMLPFAINDSTKYISPTKTPEYLAGGVPVISTPVADVVDPYGVNGLVYIANDTDEFICGIEEELVMLDKATWLMAVDTFLENNSWDLTVEKMMYLINTRLEFNQQAKSITQENEYV